MASYDQFVGVFNVMIASLKKIEQNTRCLVCADAEGAGEIGLFSANDEDAEPVEFEMAANLAVVPSGARYILITKTSANSDTITITGGVSPIVVTEPGIALKLPVLPYGRYGQINVASADGGAWITKYIV